MAESSSTFRHGINEDAHSPQSGWMTKNGAGFFASWKRRVFELGSDAILKYYVKPMVKDLSRPAPKGSLDMKTCVSIRRGTACKWKLSSAPKGTKVENMIELVLPGRTYGMFCDTELDADNWFLSLDAARAGKNTDLGPRDRKESLFKGDSILYNGGETEAEKVVSATATSLITEERLDDSSGPQLTYFNIKARNIIPLLVGVVAGKPLNFNGNPDWPAMKSEMAFGQLPLLVDGSVKLNQSMAISRYLARKYKMDGSDDLALFASSEMLTEEAVDVMALLIVSGTAEEKIAAVAKALAEKLPSHLNALEAMLGDGPTFHAKYSRVVLGDVAIYSALNFWLDVDANVLVAYPKLASFYEAIKSLPGVEAALAGLRIVLVPAPHVEGSASTA